MKKIPKTQFTDIYNKLRLNPINELYLEKNENIFTLNNFPGFHFCALIEKIWKIKNLEYGKKMFIEVKDSSITFHKFFLPEITYMVSELFKVEQKLIPIDNLINAKVVLHTELNFNHSTVENKLNLSKLEDSKLTPLPHQKPFYRKYGKDFASKGLHGCFLSGGVGCGKTMISTSTLHCTDVDVVFVVCPKRTINDIWVKSLSDPEEGFFKEPQKVWVVGDDKQKIDLSCKYFIFNYEKLEKALFLINHFKDKKIGIILDECHSCNEETSNVSDRFIRLCRSSKSENIIWMSATPIKAYGTEMINALKSFDPIFDGDCEERFKKTFTKNVGIEILNNRFKNMAFTIERDDYMDTPEPLKKDVRIVLEDEKLAQHFRYDVFIKEVSELTRERLKECIETGNYLEKFAEYLRRHELSLTTEKEQLAFRRYFTVLNTILADDEDVVIPKSDYDYCNRYERVVITKKMDVTEEAIFNDLRKIVKNPASIATQAVESYFHNRRRECFSVLAANYDFIGHCKKARKKVVVFSDYISALKPIKEQLKNGNIGYVAVHGESEHTLDEALKIFRNDDSCRLLMTTYKSLSESIALIEAADIIFLNQPYRVYIQTQSLGRCDRLLQDEQVWYYNLLLDTGEFMNLSTRAEEIMKWSDEQVRAIVKRDGIKRKVVL